MPTRYNVEPGSEWLLPLAKKKLEQLKAECDRRGLSQLQRYLPVDSGEQIHVSTVFGHDRIEISGGVRFGWFSKNLPTTSYRAGVANSRCQVMKFQGSEVTGTPALSPFNPGAGWSNVNNNYRSDDNIVGTAIALSGDQVWVGLLETYESGGYFTIPFVQDFRGPMVFPSAAAASSHQYGSMLLTLVGVTNPAVRLRMYRTNISPVTDDTGLHLNAVTTELPGAQGVVEGDFSFDYQLRSYSWAELVGPGSVSFPIRAVSVDIMTGVRTAYDLETLDRNFVFDNIPPPPDDMISKAVSQVSQLECSSFSGGDAPPWTYVEKRREALVLLLISGPDLGPSGYGHNSVFMPTWKYTSVYRGSVEMVRVGEAAPGYSQEVTHLATTHGGVGATALRRVQSVLVSTPYSVLGEPVFALPPGGPSSGELIVCAGDGVVFRTPLVSLADGGRGYFCADGTAFLTNWVPSPSGLAVVERVGGTWVIGDVTIADAETSGGLLALYNLRSLLPASAHEFRWAYRQSFSLSSPGWLQIAVTKGASGWEAASHPMPANDGTGIGLQHVFGQDLQFYL